MDSRQVTPELRRRSAPSTDGDRVVITGRAAPDESIAALLGELVADAQELMRKEMLLAKLEIKDEINKAVKGVISLSGGAALAALGVLFLLLTVVHVLAEVIGLPLWSAYLIVGAVLAAGGAAFLLMGKNRVGTLDPVPHETIDSVRKDMQWIKDQNPSVKT